MIMEASLLNEHQSNGVVEHAVQTLGAMIRTRKLAFEQSYSKELDADLVVLLWLAKHAAVTVSLFEIGSEGRTVYERSRDKPYRERVSHF